MMRVRAELRDEWRLRDDNEPSDHLTLETSLDGKAKVREQEGGFAIWAPDIEPLYMNGSGDIWSCH